MCTPECATHAMMMVVVVVVVVGICEENVRIANVAVAAVF